MFKLLSLSSGFFLLFVSTGRGGELQVQLHLSRPVETVASLPRPSEESLARQSVLAGKPAIKLLIKNEGWYRVKGEELIEAGLDPKTDPRSLQLFVDGIVQPIWIQGEEKGALGPGVTVEFYGIGIDASVTNTRVYWLAKGSVPGKRIPKLRGEGPPVASSSFSMTVERKERSIYFSSLRNGDQENYFGPVIARKSIDLPLFLRYVDQRSPAEGTFLEVAAQGTSMTKHRVRVEFNAQPLGEVNFEGQVLGVARFPISPLLLKEGENQVRLTPLGGETDISLTDYIRLSYPHAFAADAEALRFAAPGHRQVRIDSFQQPDIRVFDVTSPEKIIELEGKVDRREGGFSVTVASPEIGSRTLLALSGQKAAKPVKISLNRPSQWRERQSGADLLIITPRKFLSTLEPLKMARQKQGLQVALIDVEDIFDEFSFGHRTPQAIKDFLQYTQGQWRSKPQFVLLAGDASLDPKGYQRNENADLVPTKLLDTRLMETCSDDWLADFRGAGLASLAVGRLPFNTEAEASRMIAKILKYESLTPSQEMLLISDDNFSGYDFVQAITKLRPLIPSSIKVEQLNRAHIDATTAKRRLIEAFNRGQRMVNYMGHGSVDIWRGNLLTSAEAKTLSNGSPLPIFLMMTCLNGYFIDPALDCVAESLLKAELGGAVAVWTSSGQTEPEEQLLLNQEFLRQCFGKTTAAGKTLTLGEAVLKAKATVGDPDIRRTWILFGDPSMPLR